MEKIEARVFKNGRSQAVRIPAAYRFQGDEVYIRRNPNTGELTLSEKLPVRSLAVIYAELDVAGAADFVLDRGRNPPEERNCSDSVVPLFPGHQYYRLHREWPLAYQTYIKSRLHETLAEREKRKAG